ncbi:MAG: pilus assembly protein PilM [Candidatus Riflebacteria bacterium]|nr:pilus assembly protein PilM [Candidatus Riflebacteria bacterium]
MPLTDSLTEMFLKRVTPDILELGTHKFRRLSGVFNGKIFDLKKYSEVPSEGILNFYPDRKTAIPSFEDFQKKIAELYGGRIPNDNHVSVVLPDHAFGMGLTHLSTVTLKINPVAAIERKVQSSMPLPLSSYKLTFESGMPKGNKTPILYSVVVDSVKKEIINACFHSGLLPMSLNPSFVVMSGLIKQLESAQNSPYPSIIIHFGHFCTSVGIYLNGMMRFFDTIPIGAKMFTDALVESENQDRKEAEKKKCEEKILLEEPTSDAQGEVASYKILEPIFAELLKKIYECLQTHSQEFPQEGAFRRILISGGGAALKNFDRLLHGNLGLNVIRLGTLFGVVGPRGPLQADEIGSIIPLLGALLLEPWNINRMEKLVA